ncbi:DinB family protein [Pseudoneobacillus sp. C159]
MNLIEIRQHHNSFNEWLESLLSVDDQIWYAPLSAGKWSTAAVISHILYWDRYSLGQHFPYFRQGATLDGFPDFQQVNNEAAAYAHNGVTKEQLLEEILAVREKYSKVIDRLREEDLEISFSIGGHTLTICDYFKDFIGHDLHHQKQIVEVLKDA